MARQSSNVPSSTGAIDNASVTPRRPARLSADASTRNAPHGSTQPVTFGGQQPRNSRNQPLQNLPPIEAYDFEQLSRLVNPFDPYFEAPENYHNHPQGSSRRTPRLQHPSVHASQQLGHQDSLYGDQQAASVTSENYLEYGGGHIREPDMYPVPGLINEHVQHGHHDRDAGMGSHYQHVDRFLPLQEARMHGVTGQVNRWEPFYIYPENFCPESSFPYNGSDTDRSYLDRSPSMQVAGTQLPTHVQNSHGPNRTEATCHMHGQLFHRTYPGDEWGKFLMDFMGNGTTDNGPEPAVYHSAIFNVLLQSAKVKSAYSKLANLGYLL